MTQRTIKLLPNDSANCTGTNCRDRKTCYRFLAGERRSALGHCALWKTNLHPTNNEECDIYKEVKDDDYEEADPS